MKVMVIGASGQLATALREHADTTPGLELACFGRGRIDLSSAHVEAMSAEALAAFRPHAVINAAAYTAVDKAQEEEALARAMNCNGPGELAKACAAARVPLVHVSTDYVFDGTKPTPYVETDARAPLGVYGRTKADGEDAVLTASRQGHTPAAVIRTSWVFAATGANFVKTMLRLGEARDELGVVHDQIGRPTYAPDLANACLTAAERLIAQPDLAGVYHFGGADDASWAELAQGVFDASAQRGGPSARVHQITTQEYPTPAPRPANSRLDCTRFKDAMGLAPSPWRASVDRCLDRLIGPATA